MTSKQLADIVSNTKDAGEVHKPSNRKPVAFISGPLEVSTAYFDRYYKPRIADAINADHNFVIGPVSGIDALALQCLLDQHVAPPRIRIYMAGFEIASRPKFVEELEAQLGPESIVEAKKEDGSEALTTWDRDAAMTRASDYDILRFRTEREQKAIYGQTWRPRVSNTERNWRRRKGDTGMEDRDIRYIRHVSSGEKRLKPVWSLRRSKVDAQVPDVKECDGSCDSHRDAVLMPLVFGKQAFGFGSDGSRTT
ncbi:hypothetical protein HII31_03685 [Pseudocercospora fuligena]|uniref:Uncharacterized protein n=1 Tax=Pseudocercospora fuligena TaxID=685502 RepID=A0A8H6RPZ9_9PEZI|nr:hypothetical protein HII31_03685 [Pseudocercospora fuligena]